MTDHSSLATVKLMNTWTPDEKRQFKKLNTPFRIQLFLDTLKYNIDDITRSPREVLRTGKAHCFDGAMLAAAALEQIGFPPLLIDLRANGEDDDHILAVFKQNGRWGAIGKSNYTSCRYRDPVFTSLRELAISYFCIYFNLAGKKTLREYSGAFDLRKVKDIDWRFTKDDLDALGTRIDETKHFWLIPRSSERMLSPADDRSYKAETLGLDPRGAFQVKNSRLKVS